VAYFHGSANLAAHADLWADRYEIRGFTLAASTLDYAVRLGAAYLPPALIVPDALPLAPYRKDGARLVVAHTPTNWAVCSTEVLLAHAKDLGIDVHLVTCAHPHTALVVKTQSHATFDHLRGSFSVNSLEGAIFGSIPLFGTSQAVRERMAAEGLTAPPALLHPSDHDLRRVLTLLRDDAGLTRDLQCESRRWSKQFTPARTAQRLVAFFGSL
jgi:hypothetical protein